MKTLPSLIITADRGHVDVYCPQQDGFLREFDSLDVREGKTTPTELNTDKAGSFPNTGTMGHGGSTGERLGMEAEMEMRSFRKIAEHITEVCDRLQPKSWAFAAPSEINGAILDGLKPELKNRLAVNLKMDLVHASAHEIAVRVGRESRWT